MNRSLRPVGRRSSAIRRGARPFEPTPPFPSGPHSMTEQVRAEQSWADSSESAPAGVHSKVTSDGLVSTSGVAPELASTSVTADPDAILKELINDHSISMFRLAKSIVRDDALAEDVVQESVVKAWQAIGSFRGDSSVKSWALRITHNTAISTLRRRREDYRDPARLPEEHSSHGTERDVHGRMMIAELWSALDLLDPTSRTITVLREVEGMSYDEIADTLNLPLPTVKTRLFRARRLLANELHAWR
jgi:RNA polymerase sigma-70 factor, ECF subfamily